MQNSGSVSQKLSRRLHFYAINCKNHGFESWLLNFSVDSTLGVESNSVLVIAVSCSNICATLRANMPWSTWKRPTPGYYWPLDDWSGHIFCASASPRSLTKNTGMHNTSRSLQSGETTNQPGTPQVTSLKFVFYKNMYYIIRQTPSSFCFCTSTTYVSSAIYHVYSLVGMFVPYVNTYTSILAQARVLILKRA